FAEARDRPFETILSGPVAGAQGAAALARELGIGDAISADVGGTSFDTCLIVEGRPQLLYQGTIVGLPVQTSWIDVRSIGAGGGLTIAAASMADAIREITVEQGRDPREAVLVAFGGAGPLFATLLADELDIDRVVVPRHAGNFSAWGLLGADVTRERSATRII